MVRFAKWMRGSSPRMTARINGMANSEHDHSNMNRPMHGSAYLREIEIARVRRAWQEGLESGLHELDGPAIFTELRARYHKIGDNR